MFDEEYQNNCFLFENIIWVGNLKKKSAVTGIEWDPGDPILK